jgi:hypothetical protein
MAEKIVEQLCLRNPVVRSVSRPKLVTTEMTAAFCIFTAVKKVAFRPYFNYVVCTIYLIQKWPRLPTQKMKRNENKR